MKWLFTVKILSALTVVSLLACSGDDRTSTDDNALVPNGEARSEPTAPVTDLPTRPAPSDALDTAYDDPQLYPSDKDGQIQNPKDAAAVTHRSLTVGGKQARYTATAGHLTAYNTSTAIPDASVFYISYTVDGRDGKPNPSRPVTFFYNGGPGSSSIWLLMGSFAPIRIITSMPEPTPPAPYNIVLDNPESLLDKTDMVFINAVGTGLSAAVAPNKNQTFWGVDQDARVFSEFIFRYLTVNDRWDSPKFLFGESYGTTRSAVLALVLQNMGIQLNGISLQSSILNYKVNADPPGTLPTFGISSWYHHKVAPRFQSMSADAFAAFLRKYALEVYKPALDKLAAGQLSDADKATIAAQLEELTGIPAATWIAGNLVISRPAYRSALLAGSVLGRYDARAIGDATAGAFDPSDAYIQGVYVSMFESYLRNQLKYRTSSPFVPITSVIWDFSHRGSPTNPDVTPDLAMTMVRNPDLKVFAANGYYDLATPFFQTERDLAGLTIGKELMTHIFYGFYQSGHMSYLDAKSRKQQKVDFDRFYDDVLDDHAAVDRIKLRQDAARAPQVSSL